MSQISNLESQYKFFMNLVIASQINDYFDQNDEITLKTIQVPF
jgi:hypothetical protein